MDPRDRLLPHLAVAAKRARTDAQATTFEVAHVAHIDPSTVRRFERARAWPRDPDRLLAAYAQLGRTRPLRIWRAALDAADHDEHLPS